MICSKCGANIPDDSKFCVRCGNKIERTVTMKITNEPVAKAAEQPKEMLCPGCGAAVKPGAKFCTKCGTKQEAQPAQQAASQPQAQAQPAFQAASQAQAQPTQSMQQPASQAQAQPAFQAASQPQAQPVQQAAFQAASQPQAQPAQQPAFQAASQPQAQPTQSMQQPTPQAQSAQQAAFQAASQPQAQPAQSMQQAAPQAQPIQPQPAPIKKKDKSSKKKILIILVILFLVIDVIAGVCYYFASVRGVNPLEAVLGSGTQKEDGGREKTGEEDEDKPSDRTDGSGQASAEGEKGDAALLEPANALVEQVKAQYEAENYAEGAIPLGVEAMNQYMAVAEENNLQEEAQEGIDSVYWMYADSLIRYSDVIINQGASAAGFEQISNLLTEATALITALKDKGYSVDSQELENYKADTIQIFRDMYIQSINDITKYENWSRDEAWTYADQAYSIKENGRPVLFDDQDLEDPLRLRYVYCLAWITRKRCETGLADGSLSNADVVNSMEAILGETDYNLLLIQDIITYGSSAGMDVEKYRNAYNAIVDQIKSGQGLTIGNDIRVNSVSSVDLRHFWYFNDLNGEDKYKVDTHNGTTAATREWIRNNVPVILGE